MSDITIQVQGLGKRYRYGEVRSQNENLREDILAWLRGLSHLGRRHLSLREVRERHRDESPDYFWALKDVSFDVRHGEVVGIVGRNGAGKSTLLKILSRITPPTRGRIVYRGRVASLLEVGTGFHRDLTGRENVFLNGSVLGMKRQEIQRRFDEIVAFAEIGKFIDTPVKFYSSGMFVRLAFAVAAHLEPDILVIDEVLAVGDAAFQRKCLGKMDDVARGGRTVLFVSHNMTAVQSLCTRAIWLQQGRLVEQGATKEVVQAYLQSLSATDAIPLAERTDRWGDGSLRVTSLKFEGVEADGVIRTGSGLRIIIGYRSEKPVRNLDFRMIVHDFTSGAGLFALSNRLVNHLEEDLPREGQIVCTTGPLYLTPGRCFVNLWVYLGQVEVDGMERAGTFDVATSDFYESGRMLTRNRSLMVIPQQWMVEGRPLSTAVPSSPLETK